MSTKIFLNYRRADTQGYAHAIYNSLIQAFEEDQVFMDVNTLVPGIDAVKSLEDAVEECDILLAVIGNQWEHIRDKNGHRRLDKPDDFVRIEIAHALKRGIAVIPVLVNDAQMPSPDNLPEDLKLLTRWQAHKIGDHFNLDVSHLVEAINKTLKRLRIERVDKKREETRKIRQKEQIAKIQEINIESSIRKGDQLLIEGNGDIAKRVFIFILDQAKNNHLNKYIPILKHKISLCQELIRRTDQFHETLREISNLKNQREWNSVHNLIEGFLNNLPSDPQFDKIRNHMLDFQNEIIRQQELSSENSNSTSEH